MIKKRHYFFLFVLLYTNVFFAANKIIISPTQDSISLPSKIILTDHVIVYSDDESSHTPVVEEELTQTVIYIQRGTFLYTADKITLSGNVHLKHSETKDQNWDKQKEVKQTIATEKEAKSNKKQNI